MGIVITISAPCARNARRSHLLNGSKDRLIAPCGVFLAMCRFNYLERYREIMDNTKAQADGPKAIHPRISLGAFWRRLTSIFVKNQSPVFGLCPDQCQAKSSFDLARNSLSVNCGLNDIQAYLDDVVNRHESIKGSGLNSPAMWANPQNLSPFGHLIGIDIPTLVELVRKLSKK